MNTIWAVILAAGQSTRIGGDVKKQFLTWKGRPLFWHSVTTFSSVPKVKGIVLVFPKDQIEQFKKEVEHLVEVDLVSLPIKVVEGGELRQDSSLMGLSVLPKECSHVLIHDAARPFVSASLISRIISSLESGSRAVVPGIPPKDTVKQVRNGKVLTIPRDTLYLIQTPQGFYLPLIKKAYEFARKNGLKATDDAYLAEAMGEKVMVIEGEEKNVKITTKEDLRYLKEGENRRWCIGFGYDVHRFGNGKPLKLGGVKVSDELKVVAHSDGDVLFHALIDAILGCISGGDIGEHFPDTDVRYKDVNSAVMLSKVFDMATREGLVIEHVDVTVVAQVPKISPFKARIKRNIANILGLSEKSVNIKATTEEGLGFTGEKKGIKCIAQVLGYRKLGE